MQLWTQCMLLICSVIWTYWKSFLHNSVEMGEPHSKASESEIISHLCDALAEKATRDPGLPLPNPTISSWQSVPHELANHQSASLPSKVEVAIVGSGITGISTAYHLLQEQPNLSVTVLEARTLTSGATGRNGGHCKEVPYVDYAELKALYGKEAAGKIVRFRLAQLDAMLDVANKLGPEVAASSMIRRVEGVDIYFDRKVYQQMKVRLEGWLEDFPEERGRWLSFDGDNLDAVRINCLETEALIADCIVQRFGAINAAGCMTGPAGALWPYRLVGGVTSFLSEKSRFANFMLETNTAVESIATSADEFPFKIRTSRGEIRTRHVIHCTNGHAGHLLPGLRGALFPVRGQMTLQSAPPTFPRVGDRQSWILHYAPGYDYMTQSPTASGEIYLGGGFLQAILSGNVSIEDADIGNVRDDQQSEEALKTLETVMEERFQNGKGATVLNKWTGVMGFTIDGSPIAGKVPYSVSGRNSGILSGNGGEWVAAGFCGHGMAYCWLTGKAVAEMVLKGEESVDDWFPSEQYVCSDERFRRFSLKGKLVEYMETVA
jgi:glycine/D-amino acid oxidase-like deaminating enzyme